MNKTTVPDGDSELTLFNRISPQIYEAIEISDERACQYFESQGDPVDKWAKPDVFRHRLVRYFEAEEHKIPGVTFEALNKNGIAFIYEKRRYRLWKRPTSELPPPGWSQTKFDFLNQIVQQGELFPLEDYAFIEHNLAIILTENGNHRLRDLHLVCPQETNGQWKPAAAYWTRRIPHPGELGLGEAPLPPTEPKGGDNITIEPIQPELPMDKPAEQDS